MKNKLVASALVCALVLCAITSSVLATDAGAVPRTINVAGKGGVMVMPDIAYVSLSVITRGDTAIKTQGENNEKIAKVIEALVALGIDEADVTTASFSISQNRIYVSDTGTYRYEGYTASCTMRITVRDLDAAGQVVDSAIAAGASQVKSIQYAIEDTAPYYALALEAAGRDALSKANALASVFGVKELMVITINESNTYYAPTSYTPAMEEAALMVEADSPSATLPTQPDEISVSATISVVFMMQ